MYKRQEVQVFVAASLKNVMEDLGQQYEKEHPEVKLDVYKRQEIYKNNEVFCAEAQNEESCKKAPNL